MKIEIRKLNERAIVPVYAHGPTEDAGFDLHSLHSVVLYPGVPQLVRTGLSVAIPSGYELQIRPRSGLALKHGVTVLNSPGTIDPGYRGEIGVILHWGGYRPTHREMGAEPNGDEPNGDEPNGDEPNGDEPNGDEPILLIDEGARIAQAVLSRYEPVEWELVQSLDETVRGSGGFGSSGL